MEPIRFEITLTDEVFASRAGLALVGRLVSRTDLRRRFDALAVAGVSSPTISHGEVGLSMLGLLCLARPDYAAVEDEEPAELFQLGLGLDALPSEETLRQRLDQIGASCLAEVFTVNRLGLPGALCRCLTSTNLIDSTHSGVRQRTGRVTHWQHGSMALRWSAGAFDTTAKHYRKIMGHHQLWMLKAHLDAPTEQDEVADPREAG
jgi:hypothetical protein